MNRLRDIIIDLCLDHDFECWDSFDHYLETIVEMMGRPLTAHEYDEVEKDYDTMHDDW